jgi:uncharacterized protein YlaI
VTITRMTRTAEVLERGRKRPWRAYMYPDCSTRLDLTQNKKLQCL